MNDKFFDLKKEKQDRMINGALKIFALHGYQKASTDDIVKEAGISKGLLFHYFGSKAGLYIFVYEYSARYMSMELQRAASLRERDLFRLLAKVEDAKNILLQNYPYMQKFLSMHDEIRDKEIISAISGFTNLVPKAMEEIMERVDYGRICDNVDHALLVRSMQYVTRGLMETALTDKTPPEEICREAKAFYAMMGEQFTKEEYLTEDME